MLLLPGSFKLSLSKLEVLGENISFAEVGSCDSPLAARGQRKDHLTWLPPSRR